MVDNSVIKYFYDANCIDFYDCNEKIILKYIDGNNPLGSTPKLVGWLMEKIFILLCYEDADFHRRCLEVSTGYVLPENIDYRDKIHPMGTGLRDTEENFPYFFEPHSWQYDIFWRSRKTGLKVLISQSSFDGETNLYTGIPAGLQIKSAKLYPKYHHFYYLPICEFTSQQTVVLLDGSPPIYSHPIVDYNVCEKIIGLMICAYLKTKNLLPFFNDICGVSWDYFDWKQKAKEKNVIISIFDIRNNLQEMANINLKY